MALLMRMLIAIGLILASMANGWGVQEGQPRTLQPADLMVRDSDTLRPPDRIHPAAVREDIQLLQYALEHAYGGRRYVPEEAYAEALRQLSAVAAAPPEVPDDLCDLIADILWLIPDNHLSVTSGWRTCGKESNRQRRKPDVGSNVAADLTDETPWAVKIIEVAGKQVPLLSITRLPSPQDPSWKGYSEAVRNLLESPAVIIDLRGNGGGNDERGNELATTLLGREPAFFFDAIIKRQTPGAFLLLMNPLRSTQLSLQREGKQLPDYAREAYEETRELYQQALAGEMPLERTDEFPAKSNDSAEDAYPNPVLVLMDAACASSCEDTVLYLRQHRKALTIGEPTGGYLHFGDVGCVILPNSQLRVNLATKHFQIRGAYYERIGIDPEIRVAPGTDALDTAIRWLASHFSP